MSKPTKKTTTKKAPRKPSTRKPGSRGAEKPKAQLRRTYKGKELVVDIVDGGYVFEGETYKSLSGLAKHIVGYGISGPQFFRTAGKPAEEK